jgi:hypothetical protein
MRIALEQLSLGGQVSKEGGGRAPIHQIDPLVGRVVGWSGPLVAKLYREPLGPAALDAFAHRVSWALSLPPTSKTELYRVAAWPLMVVEDNGRLAGIVMPDQRPRFALPMRLPSGATQSVLMSLEHVLMGDEYLKRRFGLRCDPRVRASIGERLATALSILHRHSIVASDISQANVLVHISDICVVTFIDCDSMTFRGSSVLKTLETPGWELPPQWNQSPTTRTADSYKLGLAILRLFACNQSERELGAVDAAVPRSLHSLLQRSLSTRPDARPAAGSWQDALRVAISEPMSTKAMQSLLKATVHTNAQQATPQVRAVVASPLPTAGGSPNPRVRRAGAPNPMTGGAPKPTKAKAQGVASASSKQRRIWIATRRDGLHVLAWGVGLTVALFLASLWLTFKPSGASAGAVIGAAWYFFWPGLLAGAASAIIATALYDVVQVSRDHRPCFCDYPRWHPLMVFVASAIGIWSVARTGPYVSPESWSYLVITPAIAHMGALLARSLTSLDSTRLAVKGAAIVAVAASLLACVLIPRPYLVPTASAQLTVDRKVTALTNIGHCHHIPIDGNIGLLRDSLSGELQCQRHGRIGLFFVFQNAALLRLYASQRAAKARRTNARLVPLCRDEGAAYVGNWYTDSNQGTAFGTLVCYQHRARAVVEWSDSRDDVYSIVQGAGRARLYSWWRTRGVTGG